MLDRKNVRDDRPGLFPTPTHEYYQEFFTEFGELGGAQSRGHDPGRLRTFWCR